MLVGAKVCDLTEDVLWLCFLCGNFDVFPKTELMQRWGGWVSVLQGQSFLTFWVVLPSSGLFAHNYIWSSS